MQQEHVGKVAYQLLDGIELVVVSTLGSIDDLKPKCLADMILNS